MTEIKLFGNNWLLFCKTFLQPFQHVGVPGYQNPIFSMYGIFTYMNPRKLAWIHYTFNDALEKVNSFRCFGPLDVGIYIKFWCVYHGVENINSPILVKSTHANLW